MIETCGAEDYFCGFDQVEIFFSNIFWLEILQREFDYRQQQKVHAKFKPVVKNEDVSGFTSLCIYKGIRCCLEIILYVQSGCKVLNCTAIRLFSFSGSLALTTILLRFYWKTSEIHISDYASHACYMIDILNFLTHSASLVENSFLFYSRFTLNLCFEIWQFSLAWYFLNLGIKNIYVFYTTKLCVYRRVSQWTGI
jgi:hypothetical protein